MCVYGSSNRDMSLSACTCDRQDWVDPAKFALFGAAAMLGGVVRMAISLTFIIVEASGVISFGPVLMFVFIISKYVADCFNEVRLPGWMVTGQWSEVNGQRSMVRGHWSVVNGQWSIGWSMVTDADENVLMRHVIETFPTINEMFS